MKRIIWIVLCAFCVSRGALAALGEIRAAALSPGKNYSLVETEVGLIKIREYVSESGSVFAVAWNGQSHPDFKTFSVAILPNINNPKRRARAFTDRDFVR